MGNDFIGRLVLTNRADRGREDNNWRLKIGPTDSGLDQPWDQGLALVGARGLEPPNLTDVNRAL